MKPSSPIISEPSLFSDYHPSEGGYDEFQAKDGSVRPAWKDIQSVIDELGAEGLGRRVETMGRLIREYGVAQK